MNRHMAAAGGGEEHELSDSEEEEVFIDQDDVIQEFTVDDEVLPDRDDFDSDAEADAGDIAEEADDSTFIFKGHSDEVYAVACSPINPSLVATGGKDDKGFLWKINSVSSHMELPDHVDTVCTVSFSYDGQLLASGSFDGLVQIWDAPSGRLKYKAEGPSEGIEWIKWHPNGHLIIAGSEDCNVWMWNADKNACLNTFSGHSSKVTCGDFTPDGKKICSGSDDGSLRIWNPRTGESIHCIKGHPYHREGLICLSITSDSNIAISGSVDGSVCMVNIATGRVVASLASHKDSVECIGLSSSGLWVATGSMDKKLIIWDLQHSSTRCICDHDAGVTCLAWLGSSPYIATGCLDSKVCIWDSLSGDCVRVLNGHRDTVQSLAVSADGNWLVSVSDDKTARVFDISQFH